MPYEPVTYSIIGVFDSPRRECRLRPRRCEFCDTVGNMTLEPFPHSIADNVHAVRERIAAAAVRARRSPGDVHLVAVSKTRTPQEIRQAAEAGCTDFGENYLQDALPKIRSLEDLDVRWHFIGAIQSNKTRAIAEHFQWVHTVSRARIARRLSQQCPPHRTLDVTIQVNIDADPDKAGVAPAEAAALLDDIGTLENLRVRGLMTILERNSAPLSSYRRLAALFHELAGRAPQPWDTLSMGMSGDFADAIAAGATHVRIGTALFGPRLNS